MSMNLKKLFKKLIFRLIRRNYPYQMEGLITCHNADFLFDQNFLKSYAVAYKIDTGKDFINGNWYEDNQFGAYLIYTTQYYAAQASRLGGDFVECGTWKGRHAAGILRYFELSNIKMPAKFYLFDTFQGLSKEVSSTADVEKYQGDYGENVLDQVRQRFADYSFVQIVPGVLPFSLNLYNIDKIAFLMIDLNSAEAEIACLEALYPKVIDGGIIIFDDYGQTGHKDQKLQIDKFFRDRGRSVYLNPTRQGVFVK